MLNFTSRRLFSKIINCHLTKVVSPNDSIILKYSSSKDGNNQLIIPLAWLRDHCRSSNSFNEETNQRKSKMTDISEKSRIDDDKQLSSNDDYLNISWNDGQSTKYHISDLLANRSRNNKQTSVEYLNLWDKSITANIPRIRYNTIDYKEFSNKLIKYGFVIIDGIEETAEATEDLCRQLVPVHDTFFGQFWVFSNNANEGESHEDTAYGNDEIGPHTDGTYFNQTPGIQVFHCLKPAEIGGDTILVDSFKCAHTLKENHTDYYRILTSTKISHHYLEGKPAGSAINSLSRDKFIIEEDSNGDINQVRFNPYDRAPMSMLSSDINDARKMIEFYKAYECFSQLCHQPTAAAQISLKPGSVIFIDNFRVLHSRTGFKGDRTMCGCYLSRDNFYAKARPVLPKNYLQVF